MNALETIVEWLTAASLRASVLALAILTLQALLWRWLPAQWRHALWLPMLLALALPVLPAVPFSILPQPEAKRLPGIEATAPVLEAPDKSAIPAPASAPVAKPAMSWNDAMAIIWLLGAATVLSAGIAGYRRSIRQVMKTAASPDEELQHAIERAARETGLRDVPKTVVSPAVESPAVTGFFRPLLLLPSGFPEGFTPAESRLILLHELTHLKRKDLAVNWLTCVLQALHWFNPILWFAFARLRADREAACDAQVLSLDLADSRSDYGTALLKLQSAAPARNLNLGFVGIFERNHELKSRIMEISSHRRNHPAWRAGGLLLITVVTFFGATKAQEPEAREPEPKVVVDGVDPKGGKAIIERKLDAIVIPLISMEDTSLEEAIDFLRVRSVELDTTESDPAKKGINFVIRKPREAAPNAGDAGPPKLTMTLKNLPLRNVFNVICAQTGLRYQVDDFAVTFLPADDPGQAGAAPATARPPRAGKAADAAKQLIIPAVDFADVSLEEAVDFFNVKSKELAAGKPTYPIVLDPALDKGKRVQELHLREVPLMLALEYLAEASKSSITTDDKEIRLVRP